MLLDRYLHALVQQGASDLHLLEGQPPKLRTHGHMAPMPGEPPLTGELMASMMEEICPPHQKRVRDQRALLDDELCNLSEFYLGSGI